MAKYAGIKNNSICIVSDTNFAHSDFEIIEIPKQFENLPLKELLIDFKVKSGEIVPKSLNKFAKDLKVAFIANYGSQCGIGTYSKFLFHELVKYIGDYKIFAEETENLDFSDTSISRDKISICWKRGDSLSKLVEEVKQYDPDIILIQHEFGIFPNARYWISLLNQLSSYRIITTMHSVFPNHLDKTIVEAAMPEIIVHLEGAKKALKDIKQISAKIHVIPHGCFPCIDKTKLWNFYKSNFTFVQTGFGFRYKGYENAIKTVAILKEKYPDVYFTALFSENNNSKFEHQSYYNELMELIEKLDVKENVGIIRGFQSETVLNSYLKTNFAAIFPYISNKEHECFGSSGAAPFTMAKGIPVISSSIHHFTNLPTIKANSPEEMAKELDKLFSNSNLVEEQINNQNKYLEENSWEKTALKYISVFENNY